MSEWNEYIKFLERVSAEVKSWPPGKGGVWLKYIGFEKQEGESDENS